MENKFKDNLVSNNDIRLFCEDVLNLNISNMPDWVLSELKKQDDYNLNAITYCSSHYIEFFTEEFIKKHINIILHFFAFDFILIKRNDLSEDIIRYIVENIIEKSISTHDSNVKIHENSLNNIFQLDIKRTFAIIYGKYDLSEDFINKYIKYIDLDRMSLEQKLSEDFITKNKDKLNFRIISKYQKLSINFIEENIDNINWKSLAANKYLTLDVFQKYQEQFSSCLEYVSIDFITQDIVEKYYNKINWRQLSLYKNLSKEFIKNNMQYLYVDDLIANQSLQPEVKNWLHSFITIS